MSSRTTVTIYDVPYDIKDERVPLTGKQYNQQVGYKALPDDDELRYPTVGDILATQSIGQKLINEKQQLENEKLRNRMEMARIGLEGQQLKRAAEAADRADIAEQAKIILDQRAGDEELMKERLRAAAADPTHPVSPDELATMGQKLATYDQKLEDLRKQLEKPLLPSSPEVKATEEKLFQIGVKSGLPLSKQFEQIDALDPKRFPQESKDELKRRLKAAVPDTPVTPAAPATPTTTPTEPAAAQVPVPLSGVGGPMIRGLKKYGAGLLEEAAKQANQ